MGVAHFSSTGREGTAREKEEDQDSSSFLKIDVSHTYSQDFVFLYLHFSPLS